MELGTQLSYLEYEPNGWELGCEESQVFLASEVDYEAFTQARFKRWFGSLALKESVESIDARETDETNLLDKIWEAAAGSPEAEELVKINVTKAVTEACFKEDHISSVTGTVNSQGQIEQFGQTIMSVQKNAITFRPNRHQKLHKITEIEALNAHRIEDALRAGILKDYYFVVASIVPDGVPEQDLGEAGDGYYLDSLTYVAQATTEKDNGNVSIESAYIRGVEDLPQSTFHERLARRHDIGALQKIYKHFNKQLPTSAAEFLDNGLLIPKELMPNGVADFMGWCQEGLVTSPTLDEQCQKDVIEGSRNREVGLSNVIDMVYDELLDRSQTLKKPMAAVSLMWQLAKKYTLAAAYKNKSIDPRVFGRPAAKYIYEIRQKIGQGGVDPYLVDLMQKAQSVAVVTGCGGGSAVSESPNNISNSSHKEGEDRFGSLRFTCPKGHINQRPNGRLLSHCQVCGTSVKC